MASVILRPTASPRKTTAKHLEIVRFSAEEIAFLRGEGRNIDRIEMTYLKNPTKPMPALVTVLGRIAT
jgi:hypothetical protein